MLSQHYWFGCSEGFADVRCILVTELVVPVVLLTILLTVYLRRRSTPKTGVR